MIPERDLPIARIWTWSESKEITLWALDGTFNLIDVKNSNEWELGNSERNDGVARRRARRHVEYVVTFIVESSVQLGIAEAIAAVELITRESNLIIIFEYIHVD